MKLHTPIPNMHYSEYTPVVGFKRWVVGVDIGVRTDYTSFTVIEDVLRPAPRYGRGYVQEFEAPEKTVVQSFRLPKGSDYPLVVETIAAFSRASEFKGDCHLFIDATGAGAAVVSLLKKRNVRFDEVVITSGQAAGEVGYQQHRVAKGWLVNHLSAALSSGELKISKNIIDYQNLRRELEDYQIGFSSSGQMTFNARDGQHDDAIISMALALYGTSQIKAGLTVSSLRW